MFGASTIFVEHSSDTLLWARREMSTAQHGTLLLAGHITSAHGRQGRSWVVVPGQALMTFILKPSTDFYKKNADSFFLAMSYGLLAALRSFIPGALLKWPNDVYVDSKKVAGLLQQAIYEGDELQGVILGIGVNVCSDLSQTEVEQTATSLHLHLASPIAVHDVVFACCHYLEKAYQEWQANQSERLFDKWRKSQLLRAGSEVMLDAGEKSRQVTVVGYAADGGMVVSQAAGHHEIVYLHQIDRVRL